MRNYVRKVTITLIKEIVLYALMVVLAVQNLSNVSNAAKIIISRGTNAFSKV